MITVIGAIYDLDWLICCYDGPTVVVTFYIVVLLFPVVTRPTLLPVGGTAIPLAPRIWPVIYVGPVTDGTVAHCADLRCVTFADITVPHVDCPLIYYNYDLVCDLIANRCGPPLPFPVIRWLQLLLRCWITDVV